MRLVAPLIALVILTACPEPAPQMDPLEAAAAKKCPTVHLDRLAADWIVASGDVKTRLRIQADGDGYTAFYTGGLFNPMTLKGVKRDKDVRFEEVPSASRLALEASGTAKRRTLLFVQPNYRACSLQVFTGVTDGAKEAVATSPTEFLSFPETPTVFSFEPYSEPLFVGEAAQKKAVADKQLEEIGAPKPDVGGGTVPVAAWSKVAADGDPSCTYDMDLYFDDQLVPELTKQPAGAVDGDSRLWSYNWSAPYAGNHTFQIYRYRTCAGGERARIGIAGIEAILY